MRDDVKSRQEVEPHEALAQIIDSYMFKLHTGVIAEVVSFDESKNTVDVQPLIMRKMRGAEPRKLAIIKNAPVLFYGAGGYVVTFKPQKGDVCELLINERSLAVWKQSGGIVDCADPRHHDLSDAVALFGLNHYAKAYQNLRDGIDVRTRDGNTSAHLQDGTITLTIGGQAMATITAESIEFAVGGSAVATLSAGGIEFHVPVNGPSGTFGGKVVESHTHSGVQSGGSNSGPPT